MTKSGADTLVCPVFQCVPELQGTKQEKPGWPGFPFPTAIGTPL